MKTRRTACQSPAEVNAKKGRTARTAKQSKTRKRRLTALELEGFRQRLLSKRCELIGDTNRLHHEAVDIANSSQGSGSSFMPIHLAERASDTWEQGMTMSLAETTASLLREIEAALGRIRDKTYGFCEATGAPISKVRLTAIPWTRYCIGYALKLEAG